jgi:S-adenosylmethionine:tRNA ribosyltransferase-isomerase
MDSVNLTHNDYDLKAYGYDLPEELIAARPIAGRSGSKLLVCDAQNHVHEQFKNLPKLLPKGATLVLNRSRVFPCRLFGHKPSGGSVEAFVLSLTPKNNCYQVLLKASGKRKVGEIFQFDDLLLTIESLDEGIFWVSTNLEHQMFLSFLETKADVPIPPYIRGGVSDERDRTDYQTVYAKEAGSVAAPTAGLHFTEELLAELEASGIQIAYVTLHVGLGTFRPVKSADIREHQMHAESFFVEASEAKKIQSAKGPIFAVGTTSLRVLESCFTESGFQFKDSMSSTNIFLYPGKPIKSIQGLITNFHLPESSLIMLVSAILGRERTLSLYKEAIAQKYRFFSYGDAMLIRRENV